MGQHNGEGIEAECDRLHGRVKELEAKVERYEKALEKIAALDNRHGMCSYASGCDSPAIAKTALDP